MNRKRYLRQNILLLLGAITISGCARSCEGCQRSVQTGKREYLIRHYSGGEQIGEYRFRGIVNDAENSDGYYWYQGDTLVEVAGDVVIRSWKSPKKRD